MTIDRVSLRRRDQYITVTAVDMRGVLTNRTREDDITVSPGELCVISCRTFAVAREPGRSTIGERCRQSVLSSSASLCCRDAKGRSCGPGTAKSHRPLRMTVDDG